MAHLPLTPARPHEDLVSAAVIHDPRGGVWAAGWRRLRSPAGAVGVVMLVGLALLVLLVDVMQGAVQRGELRRQAEAALAEARWPCSTSRGTRRVGPSPRLRCP